jgi:hypothetical protein
MRMLLGRLTQHRPRVEVFRNTLIDTRTQVRDCGRLFRSKHNHDRAQELHRLQSRSIAGAVLLCMQVRRVLFQILSEERLEEAAQENLQASQRGAWRHAGAT